jgi:hypothetical protein
MFSAHLFSTMEIILPHTMDKTNLHMDNKGYYSILDFFGGGGGVC